MAIVMMEDLSEIGDTVEVSVDDIRTVRKLLQMIIKDEIEYLDDPVVTINELIRHQERIAKLALRHLPNPGGDLQSAYPDVSGPAMLYFQMVEYLAYRLRFGGRTMGDQFAMKILDLLFSDEVKAEAEENLPQTVWA